MFKRVVACGIVLIAAAPFFAAAATCPSLMHNLSFGSRGDDVIVLQQFLISQNVLASGNDSGYFGKLTEAAVQQWQTSHGIVSSGSAAETGYGAVGPKTRAAIAAACSGTSGTVNPNQNLIDSLLAQVKALQEQLAQLIGVRGGGSGSGGGSSVPPTYTYIPPTTNTTSDTSTNTSTSQVSCSWSGGTVASGSSVTAYQSLSVAYGSQCASQTRTCANGTLSGSYQYASCTVQTASSPTATLTANGATSLTVNVGDTVNYAWSSTGAVSAKSSYTTDTPSCGQTTNGPLTWNPSTLSGTLASTISACGAGHTYTFTYTATDALGKTASATVTVRVSRPFSYSTATLTKATHLIAGVHNMYEPTVLTKNGVKRMWLCGWLTADDPNNYVNAKNAGVNVDTIVGSDKICNSPGWATAMVGERFSSTAEAVSDSRIG